MMKWSLTPSCMSTSTSLNGTAVLNGQSATPDFDHNDYNSHLRQLEQGSKVQLQDALRFAHQFQFLEQASTETDREREREREMVCRFAVAFTRASA